MKRIFVMVLLFILLTGVVSAQTSSSTTAMSVSLVNQDPDPSIAGGVVEIRIGVENLGGMQAEDLVIELVPEYPFTLPTGTEAIQNIGTIKGYQYDEDVKIVKFKLKVDKDAIAGDYELKVRHYAKNSIVYIQHSLSLEVQARESAEVIHIDKTTLTPGNQTALKFTINNVGNAPLRDLTFSWANEEGAILPVGSDNTRYLKYIDIGESEELDYEVIADTNAEPGLYAINLLLVFEDPITGEDKEITTIAGLYVGGGTDFDVAFSESSAGETSFTVSNIGSNSAYSVSVIVPEQSAWRIAGSNTMIIGNLNKGDYTVASFRLQPSQTRPDGDAPQEDWKAPKDTRSDNKITLQIAYTDTMGKRSVVEKEVSVYIQPSGAGEFTMGGFSGRGGMVRQESFGSKYKWHILIIIVAVLAYVGHSKYKKKKLKNPNLEIKDLFKRGKKK